MVKLINVPSCSCFLKYKASPKHTCLLCLERGTLMGSGGQAVPNPRRMGRRDTYTLSPPGLAGLPGAGPMLEKALGWSRL